MRPLHYEWTETELKYESYRQKRRRDVLFREAQNQKGVGRGEILLDVAEQKLVIH